MKKTVGVFLCGPEANLKGEYSKDGKIHRSYRIQTVLRF